MEQTKLYIHNKLVFFIRNYGYIFLLEIKLYIPIKYIYPLIKIDKLVIQLVGLFSVNYLTIDKRLVHA